MTQRKPPGVSWESWIEQQIRAAQEKGEFDELPGTGKPLPDVTGAYDPDWWLKRLVQRERVSLVPGALRIKARVEQELERIWKLSREVDVRASVVALNAEIATANRTTISGPPTSVAPFDVETIVQQWRERRVAG